uniref:Uncharacterized protein n=1 Tax=Setaria viridis TaxID=4556 RepID=A0A4U6SZA7_SETVI|nr:hypothetical protein SEVIR_9G261650v2 [Setaria viridis]
MSLSLLLAMPASTFLHRFLGPIIPKPKGQKRNREKEIAKRTDAQNTTKKSDTVFHAPCLS